MVVAASRSTETHRMNSKRCFLLKPSPRKVTHEIARDRYPRIAERVTNGPPDRLCLNEPRRMQRGEVLGYVEFSRGNS
jgi:hypothetical protein